MSRNKDAEGNNQGLYVAGRNDFGALFTKDTSYKVWATPIETDKDILTMAETRNHEAYNTGLIVDQDGMVYTIGYNVNGEMGEGTTQNSTIPTCISKIKVQAKPSVINYKKAGDTGEKITYSISAGFNLLYNTIDQTECIYKSLDTDVATVSKDGIVTAVGDGTTYIRVYNEKTNSYAAVKVNVNGTQGKTYPKIVAGANHFAALKANGEIWTWGYNGYGNLGLSDTVSRTKPTNTNIGEDAVDVATGAYHTLVLKEDGTVWSVGNNNYGQLGDGTTTNKTEFVQVKDITGEGYLKGIIAIAANNNMSYALSENGNVYSWGYNGYGNLGIGYGDSSAHTIPSKVQKVSNIIQIASGENYLVMLDADGSVWSVGYNGYGQFGINTAGSMAVPQHMRNSTNEDILYGVKQVSAGAIHTVLAMEDGTALAVGYNGYGALATGDTNTKYLPVQMLNENNEAIKNVKNVSANGHETIVSVKEQTVTNEAGEENREAGIYVAGYNNYGQLYTKDTTTRYNLTKVQEDKNIIAMASTTNVSYQTSAIADNMGLVYTVGYNGNGEMGDDTVTTTINPTSISEARFTVDTQRVILNLDDSNNTKQINAATDLGFNLLYDQVEGEQLTYNSLDTNIATVSDTGLITAKNYGITKVEVSTNKLPNKAVVTVEVLRNGDKAYPKVVSGQDFTVALKADGTVWTWGYNAYGQLGTKDQTNRYKPTKIAIENVIDISAGDNYTLVLTKEGKVYSFGNNSYGQLGRSGDTLEIAEISNLENITQIAASSYNAMALTASGEVYTWGYNYYGQLGDRSNTTKYSPIKIKLQGIVKIAGKNQTSTAVDSDGKLYTWGYNGYGQLGNNSTNTIYVPTEVMNLENIVDVAVGNNTIIALDKAGYVYTSGYNAYGNLGNNSTSNRYNFDKVIEKFETTGEGEDSITTPVYLANVKQIEAGSEYAVAINKDGNAYAWGNNAYTQFANGTTNNSLIATNIKYSAEQNVIDDVLDVATAANSLTVVRKDGKVWTAGRNNVGQLGDSSIVNKNEFVCISNSRIRFEQSPIRIKGIGNSVNANASIIAGFNLLYNTIDNAEFKYSIRNSAIAQIDENTGKITSVKKGKTQVTAIENTTNEKSSVDVYVLGDEDITFPQIETVNEATLALKANGEVWAYGYNGYGVLATGDTTNKILPTYTGINNIVQIALGTEHALAVDANGNVWSWGYNNYGQLGDGTTNNSYTKVQVKSPDGEGYLENIVAVAAGDSYSLALDKDGNVYSWGYNGYGALGHGDRTTRKLPTQVQALEKITKIEVSNQSSFAIDNENRLWVAGYNGYGNLGDGTTGDKWTFTKLITIEEVAEVSASTANSTIALLLDGTVWGFGNNTNYGLANVGGAIPQQLQTQEGMLENVTSISEGVYSGYAVTGEEKVVAWGLNNYGQLATGNNETKNVAVYMQDKDGNDFTDVMLISGGVYSAQVAKNDGTVWSIGLNSYGELGDGSTISKNYLECISTQYIKLNEREVVLKLSNPNYQINPETIYGFNLLYEKATNNGFKYVSSNSEVAMVNENTGLVTAKGLGRTYITLKSISGDFETRVVVNVIGEDKVTVEKVATGYIHSLALKQDGTVWAWGDNSNGEIGNNVANSAKITEPTRVEKGEYLQVVESTSEDGSIITTTTLIEKELKDIKDIAAGNNYNLILDNEGNVWSWGYNGYGQLGNETTEDKYIPTKIENLNNIKKVYISGNTSIALNNNGEVFVWGKNYTKVPTKLECYNKIVEVAGKIMLAEDGTVWTLSNNANRIAGLSNIVEIASGENYYYALDTKGNVWAWGYNGYGQLGQSNQQNVSEPVKVQIELKYEDENGDEITYQKPISDIVEIEAGNNSVIMINKDSEIYSCGYNADGQLGLGEYSSAVVTPTKAVEVKNIKNVSSNLYHTIASDKSGFVYTTGYNGYGELGDETLNNRNILKVIGDTYVNVRKNVVTMQANDQKQINATLDNKFNLIKDVIDSNNMTYKSLNEDIAVVNADGLITAKQIGKAEIVVTHTITNKSAIVFVNVVPNGKIAVPKVESGSTHMSALKADGTVWTWGLNTNGQLGTGDNNQKASPVKVTALENITDISVGEYNTICVKNDGTVWSFGHNGYGILGDGTSSDRNVPVQVIKENGQELGNIVKVATRNYKTVALDTQGYIWTWGGQENSYTARKITELQDIIDISANYAVNIKGEVFSINTLEKLQAEKVIRVSEGATHTVFLRNDSKAYALGENSKGQLGVGDVKKYETPELIKSTLGTGELKSIREIKAGNEFTIAVLKNGEVYTWGSNENYKLATTQETNQVLPKKNENFEDILSVDAGTNNGVVINNEGFVYTWGLGEYGANGNKLFSTTSEPVLVGRQDVGLNSNNITIKVGETFKLEVLNKTFNVIKDVVDNSQMSFKSQIDSVAQVDQTGLITAKQIGETTIVVNKVGTQFNSIARVTVIKEDTLVEPMALTCESHTIVLKADGTVWSYGLNTSYELGNGTTKSSDIPVKVKFPEGIIIKQIAVGNTHNLALDTEGNVWGWGVNSNYALGTTTSIPVKLGITNISKIGANNDQSIAITNDGYVYVWGLNANGELGTRTYETVKVPTLLPYVNDIIDVACGKNHTMLLTSSGKVLASGLNVYGQTTKEEGKSNVFEEIELDELIGQIAAGDNHSVLLTTNGEVYTFGYNINGQLASGNNQNVETAYKVTNMQDVMKVSAGKNHTIILTSDRKLYSAGSNSQGELGIGNTDDKVLFTKIESKNDIINVDSGNTYSLAIDGNGDVYGWGNYYHGIQNIKTKTNSRIPVKIGNNSSYADEQEITLNVNATKQIEITPRFIFNVYKENDVSSGFKYVTANKNIATVSKAGLITAVEVGKTWVKAIEENTGKENVIIVSVIEEGQKNAPEIATGENYAAVLKADGSIWSFGYNSDGQLGNDKLVPINIPSQTNILSTYKKVVSGKSFTLAIRDDGTVWAWGDNTYGVLGQGNRTSAKKPIQVQGISNIVNIAAGDNHVIAIDEIGNVYTWGLNSNGQLGNNTTKTLTIPEKINAVENQIISIAAGGNMTAFVDSEGKVYVFGENTNEQIAKHTNSYDVGTNTYYATPKLVVGLENVVKVQCMNNAIVALRSDGSIQIISKYAIEQDAQKEIIALNGMIDISAKDASVMALDKYGKMYTYGNNVYGQAGIGSKTDNETLQKIALENENFMEIGAGFTNNYAIDTNGFVYAAGLNTYGQLGNSTYEDSNVFTIVGDRNFAIIPETRTMKQPEEEKVSVKTNIFNVFNHNDRKLTDYDWKSSNDEVATVENGIITSQDMGEVTITATDKLTGATATALRVIQPLDEQRIDSIYVNGKEAILSGENKYAVSVVANADGTGTLKITTKDATDVISIDEGANYVVSPLLQDVELDTNPKIVKIRVKTTNGKIVSFILTIDVVSENAALESLTVDGIEATSIGSTEYEIVIPNDVVKPQVKGITSHSNAKISIDNGAKEQHTTTRTVDMSTKIKKVVPIIVTSESGNDVSYTLTIYKEDALTELESLTVNNVPATKINKNTYKVIIDAELETSEICATSVYPTAEIKINNLPAEVKVTKRIIATINDQTIVKIYVTAQEKEKEYTLVIDKAGTENNLGIFSVTVNGILVEPVGNIYDAYTTQNTTSVSVEVITIDDKDLVQIDGYAQEVHKTTQTVEVNDNSSYKITVTDPEDSTKTKEYTLNIKKPSSDVTIKSITVGNTEFSREAMRIEGTNIYKVGIPAEYEEIGVIAVTNYELADISVDEKEYEQNITKRTVAISEDPTDIKVLVKAQNGDIEEYTLRIARRDGNKNLKQVTVDGNVATLSTTQKDTYEYTLDKKTNSVNVGAITEQATSYVGINNFEQEKNATYRDVAMDGKSIVTYINVTAEDGTTKEYKLVIYALPDNVKLESVKVNQVEAEAVPTNTYKARVNKNAQSFELYVIPEDQKAKVRIGNNAEVVGTTSATIAKETEVVEVKIYVTAQDGTEEEYTLIVENKSDDTSLAMIKVDDEVITKSDDGKYYTNKPFLTKNVTVEALANDSRAKVSINSTTATIQRQKSQVTVPDSVNYINVRIIAEDESYKDYVVVVNKLPNNTNVKAYVIMGEQENETTKEVTFDANGNGTIKVENNEQVKVKATAEDTLANISINGSLPVEHEAIKEVCTIEEETQASIEVTAQDGTKQNYTIKLVRNSANNVLESLTAKELDKDNILKTSDNTYTITMPDTMTELEITAIAKDENAKVQIEDDPFSETNTATGTVLVEENTKVFEIVVRAENGEDKHYTITVNKQTDLRLLKVEANGQECIKQEDGTYVAFRDKNIVNETLVITPKNPLALVSTQIGVTGDFSTLVANTTHTVEIKDITEEEVTVIVKVQDPVDSTRTKQYTVVIKEKSHNADLEIIQVDGKDAIYMDGKYYAETTTEATSAIIYAKAQDNYANVRIGEIGSEEGSITKEVALSTEKKNAFKLVVTAQDGTTQKSYDLVIERKSTDTSVAITVDTETPDKYDESTLTYTKYIPREKENATVTAITTSDKATVEIAGESNLQTLSKEITTANEITTVDVVVKPESGDAVTYHVNIVKYSTDNTIATVKVNDIVVEEVDGKYEVTLIDNGKESQDAQIEVISNNEKAKVQIGEGTQWFENIARSTVTFKDGKRVITLNISVKPQHEGTDTLTKELKISIKSDDNTIKSVKDGENEITVYDEQTHTYTEYIKKDVEEVTLAIEANSQYTTLETESSKGTGMLSVGNISTIGEDEKVIHFTSTSETGRSEQYTIIIRKMSDNANAEHIYVEGIDIIDKFENVGDVPTYIVSIEKEKAFTTIQVIAENEFAKIQIGDAEVGIANITRNINLNLSDNSITVPVVITSQDGSVVKTYNIMFVRLSNNNKIQWLEVNDKHIIEDAEGNYEVTVKASQETAKVKITLQDELAKVTLGGDIKVGELSETIILPESGDTIKTITVTAQDGTVATYKLTIHKQENDLGLKEVYLNNRIATKLDDNTFEIDVMKNVTLAEIKAIANKTTEYVTIKDGQKQREQSIYTNCNISENEIIITVTAMFTDGENTEIDQQKDYRLVINRVEEPDVVNDLKVEIKVNNEELQPDEDGHYIKILPDDADNATVWAQVNSITSKVKILDANGETTYQTPEVERNVNITEDKTIVTVTVKNGAEDTKEYKVYLVKESAIDEEAELKQLFANGKEIRKEDDGSYTVAIPKDATKVELKAIASSEFAKVNIDNNSWTIGENTNNVEVGDNTEKTVIVKVKTIAGTEKQYIVNIVREPDALEMKNIYVDNRLATKVDDTNYSIDVLNTKTTIDIKAELFNTESEYVSIFANTPTIGVNTYTQYELANGYEIEIVASNGVDNTSEDYIQKVYTLKIITKNSIEDLSDLQLRITVNGNVVQKDENGEYKVYVDKQDETAKVEATASTKTTKVKIDDLEYTVLKSTKTVTLDGKSTKVTVYAQNGEGDVLKYEVYIVKGKEVITGKVITQAVNQEQQSALITIYRTEDTNPEKETADETVTTYREIVKQENINPDGTYEIEIDPGEYDIVITKTSYLEYRITNVIVKDKQDTKLNDIKIFAGDIVKSGEIEIDDMVELNDNYGVIDEQNKEKMTKYDLNEDGIVNKLDRNILKENYGKKARKVTWIDPDAENMILPLEGSYVITSEYGTRVHPITGKIKTHSGLDIVGTHHGNILSVANGEVTYAGVQSGYGNCVEIKHIVNGATIYSFYAHLSQIDVVVGQAVAQGEVIGLEGGAKDDPNHGTSTGHHLHFELRSSTGSGNSVDPNKYINF